MIPPVSSDPIFLGLPHRPPFLFIDEIIELELEVEAVGTKRFMADEAFFAGHFPGDPIVPGVILTEALAQVAGIAGASRPGTRFLLSAIRVMKFHRPVRPGEQLVLRARKRGNIGPLVNFEVSARVGDAIVAEGQIVLTATD